MQLEVHCRITPIKSWHDLLSVLTKVLTCTPCGVLHAANYYDILGVDIDASEDDIRSAYRKKAKQLHPDVNKEVGGCAAGTARTTAANVQSLSIRV